MFLWGFQRHSFTGTQIVRLLKALLICCLFSLNSWSAEVVSGDFDLIDHRGERVNKASYNDKIRMVFFGFTRCPIICPTTMSEISQVMRKLEDRASLVQPIFITIDPENDTTEAVANYVGAFHPSMVGLTGSPEQIDKAAKAFNVAYGKTSSNGQEEEIYHSSYVYVMDKEGNLLDLIGYGTRADIMLEKLETYL